MKKPKLKEALDCVNLVSRDAYRINVSWDFDEQQADPCHHNFDGRHFVRCLIVVVDACKDFMKEQEKKDEPPSDIQKN